MTRSEEMLYRLAATIIAEYGEYARLRALLRASNMRNCGEAERAAAWSRIADIIGELEAETPPRNRRH